MILYYNRKTKSYVQEKEYQGKLLQFLYTTVPGRIILKLVVARPWFSRLRARYQNSRRSQKDIVPFIQKYGVDITPYEANWKCFNDFFTRKRCYSNCCGAGILAAIADAKLSVYPIDDELCLPIKKSIYTLGEIVDHQISLDEFKNGTALIFRLSVDDYHRYVYPDDGELLKQYQIKGELHTVRPVSEKYRVYSRNTRVVNVLSTRHFGKMIQIEVGALLVGCITNNSSKFFKKLDEKGYFSYGGSTIILLVENTVAINEDILEQSRLGYETKVTIGDIIGEIRC